MINKYANYLVNLKQIYANISINQAQQGFMLIKVVEC